MLGARLYEVWTETTSLELTNPGLYSYEAHTVVLLSQVIESLLSTWIFVQM